MDDVGFPLVDADPPLHNRMPIDGAMAARVGTLLGATVGPFVTVNRCSGLSALGEELYARTLGICESMEGAAAAHVCALYELPFIEGRAASNMVEDRDRSRWRVGREGKVQGRTTMFRDEASIGVIAGRGGDGMSSFRREKYIIKGGPDGGDGGDGGSVLLVASGGLNSLLKAGRAYRYSADQGRSGGPRKCTGARVQPRRVEVPAGTQGFDEIGRRHG